MCVFILFGVRAKCTASISPLVSHIFFFCEVGMKQEVFPPQRSTAPLANGAPLLPLLLLLLSVPRPGTAALHFGCDKTQPPT